MGQIEKEVSLSMKGIYESFKKSAFQCFCHEALWLVQGFDTKSCHWLCFGFLREGKLLDNAPAIFKSKNGEVVILVRSFHLLKFW